jgi:ribonuclease R
MTDKWKKLEEAVIRFFKDNPGQQLKGRELAGKLRVPNRDYQTFKRKVRRLADEGRLSRFKGNRYGVAGKSALVSGILHVKTQGYGFIRREDGGEDVFISQRNMGSAQHQDRVQVSVLARPMDKLAEGKVVDVLERGRSRIVGTFQQSGKYSCVIPDELKLTRDVYIAKQDRNHAKNGDKVVIEITQWGDARRMPEGKVLEVLGPAEKKGVDVLSVIHAFELPFHFPQEAVQETGRMGADIASADLLNRLDLRDKLVFTVDPDDAKDFDDAISLEKLSNGNVSLGVHIADVSHFVQSGSGVDMEALRRGTSVYLVDQVIPMLPERLSNELCSLRPDEDRLTYSVIMELTPAGELEEYRICESVIHSKARFTYKEVQFFIDTLDAIQSGSPKGSQIAENRSTAQARRWFEKSEMRETIGSMAKLSRVLKKRRWDSGSIPFDAPEPRVVLDQEGFPVELGIRERSESHELIESFMLLANQTVAEHVDTLRKKQNRKLPFIYRIHERPEGKKLNDFVHFVRALGYAFDPGKRVTSKKFQRLLEQVAGSKHAIIVEEVALRTMMKAVYATRNPGHFGLGCKHYTHFTSPIRRYPDLMVHRLIKAYEGNGDLRPVLPMKLSRICELASEREIMAQKAERESIKAKQLLFMKGRIGDEFDGVISGVTTFGIFVEIPEYLVEGLVHIKDLEDDYYLYDEKRYCLSGKNHGKVYRLGDSVRVVITRVSLEMRKLDFMLAS